MKEMEGVLYTSCIKPLTERGTSYPERIVTGCLNSTPTYTYIAVIHLIAVGLTLTFNFNRDLPT